MTSESTAVDIVLALLFVADSPTTAGEIARAIGYTEGQVEQAIEALAHRLEEDGPLMLAKLVGGFQLTTKPEFAERIGAFLQPQRQRMTRSLLEVLAVVAYRQPITLAEIDAVRGVQSDYSLHALAERRLVAEVGRKQVPGRPILWGTTHQFLHQFNMNDLTDLPEVAIVTGD